MTPGAAVETTPAVLLDANVYRSLTEARFAALLELECRRGVARFGEPFSIMELLAHLADPKDPAYTSCRRAIGKVFRRCGPGAGEPCGIIRDSESRLVELVTGKGLEGHDARTETLGILVGRIAATPLDQPLSEEEASRLRVIADHVTETEAKFAGTGRLLQQIVKAVLDSEEDPAERQRILKSAMATHASDVPRKTVAESLLRNWYREIGLSLPEPPPPELVARVLKFAPAWIESEVQLWRKVGFDGANIDASRIRNLRWDQRIAFNIGQVIGRWTLWLVTDDSAFARVAAATGFDERVRTLAAYEKWLEQETP